MNKWFWLSCRSFTIRGELDNNNIITDVAPIARWSKGKPLTKLQEWVQHKIGKVDVKVYQKEEKTYARNL